MILIVGGAGYIGSHVNKYLYNLGYKTLVFDNLDTGHKEYLKWGEFIFGDINNIEHIRLIFKKYPIDAIMHFAASAYIGESNENPQKYYNNNVKNTLNLLDVMIENKVNILVYSSSCSTYGIPKVERIDENYPQNPINPYGRSKLMVEQILKDYADVYNIKYVSLRYFNASGADPEGDIGEWHEPETHLIPLILDVAIGKRENIKLFGVDYDTHDGSCIRDYIHVNDIANAHIKALEYLINGGKSEFFNICNGNGYSVREVIDYVEIISGKKVKYIETRRRPGDPDIITGCAEKAFKVLGWCPIYRDLSGIIKTAWNWHQILYNTIKYK